MWAEAQALFALHRSTLAAAGVPLRAALEPVAGGLLCAFSDGRVRLALPDESPVGRLRAALLAGLLGLPQAQLDWLYRALLPRLVAHEIGHALRAEAGLLTQDVRLEEQVADRLGQLLSRPVMSAAERARSREVLGAVVARLGGLGAAAGLHRSAAQAQVVLGARATALELREAAAHLQTHYHRDLDAYLRVTVAWAYIDLTLDEEDSLDRFKSDHLPLAA